MADDQNPKSYEELKESLYPSRSNPDHPGHIDLRSIANTVFAVKKWTDIASIVAFGSILLGNLTSLPPTFTLLPIVSGALGVAGAIVESMRGNAVGGRRPSDTPEVSGFRQEFAKAARGASVKQWLSAGLSLAAPLMLGIGIVGAFSDESLLAFIPASVASALAGGGIGLWSRGDNTKMNVYETAIRKASSPPAP